MVNNFKHIITLITPNDLCSSNQDKVHRNLITVQNVIKTNPLKNIRYIGKGVCTYLTDGRYYQTSQSLCYAVSTV